MKKVTIFNDPELGEIDTEVGKQDLDELAQRIADVTQGHPAEQNEKDDFLFEDGKKDSNAMKHLLIVEDDTGVSSLVSDLVTAGGFKVDCCEDGERALELMRKTKYDVVYLGILMPKINGLDVLKTIQKDKIPHGKILIVTALNADVTINMILNLGAAAYIDMNQITIEELADRLKLELFESGKKRTPISDQLSL